MRSVGRHGHNRPAFLAAELRHRLLEQVKRPANVNGKGLLPVFLAQRIGRPHPQNTGGIDQHIQPRDPCQQAAARLRHLLRVGNVQRLGGERVAFAVERQIEPGYLRAGLNERQGGGVADPLARAGDPHGPAVKIEPVHYFTSRESSAHQASMVGFFASTTKSISPCTLRQRAASAIMRTESRP